MNEANIVSGEAHLIYRRIYKQLCQLLKEELCEEAHCRKIEENDTAFLFTGVNLGCATLLMSV